MNNQLLEEITNEYLQEKRDHFKVGDGVQVHVRVREGGKERIQVFGGIVIARKGSGVHESFTVRRIASGVGVERVFPVHSPLIDKVEVDRESVTMRARMYYLRDRIGKEANKVKEKRLYEAKSKTSSWFSGIRAVCLTLKSQEDYFSVSFFRQIDERISF